MLTVRITLRLMMNWNIYLKINKLILMQLPRVVCRATTRDDQLWGHQTKGQGHTKLK